jgi:hypothetical protein
MKPVNGMKRGVKLDPKPTKTERMISMDRELQNTQMAGRITQQMVQQLLQQVQSMAKDLGKAFGTINEMQYKILAMQSVGNFDMTAMAKKAEELRLNDFAEASDAEDKAGSFTVGETVQDDSTVIVTSTTAGEDAGIFRSRIVLAECGVPALIKGFAGQPVGTKVTCQLNGVEHVVELLAIRNPPPAVVVEPPAGQVVAVGEPTFNPDGSVDQKYVRASSEETVH